MKQVKSFKSSSQTSKPDSALSPNKKANAQKNLNSSCSADQTILTQSASTIVNCLCLDCLHPCSPTLKDYFRCRCCSKTTHFTCCKITYSNNLQDLVNSNNCWFLCNSCANSPIQLVNCVDNTIADDDNSILQRIATIDSGVREITAKVDQINKQLHSSATNFQSSRNYCNDIMRSESIHQPNHIFPKPLLVKAELRDSSNDNKFQIKIDGIPENPFNTQRSDRILADSNAVKEIFDFIHANVKFSSIRRQGKYLTNTNRSVLVDLTNSFDLNLVLQNAKALKNHVSRIFINKVLYGDEAIIHRNALKERWRIIQEGIVSRNDITLRDGVIRIKGIIHEFTSDKPPTISNKQSNITNPSNSDNNVQSSSS